MISWSSASPAATEGRGRWLIELRDPIERLADRAVVGGRAQAARVGCTQALLRRVGERNLGGQQVRLWHGFLVVHHLHIVRMRLEAGDAGLGDLQCLSRAEHRDVGLGDRELQIRGAASLLRAGAPCAGGRRADRTADATGGPERHRQVGACGRIGVMLPDLATAAAPPASRCPGSVRSATACRCP